jgi:mannose-1-phosphate guanylyltransferase/mannose-6-phosphate isomerase
MDMANELHDEARVSAHRIQPVILSGGYGTRLWPLSRKSLPKQLLPLVSERSLLQETASRTAAATAFASPLIVCSHEHRDLVAAQMATIGIEPRLIIAEPVGRNTAPALAVAALVLIATDPDVVLLVEPSDHRIGDAAAFCAAVERGLDAAAAGYLVAFGIAPDRPETGYGYIRQGEALAGTGGAFAISRFVEKPGIEDAVRFAASDRYLWNSGIFLMEARRYLEELEALEPQLLLACADAVAAARREGGMLSLDTPAFAAAAEISIDRAVMERTRAAAVVPLDVAWDDVGSWRTLRDFALADGDGNVVVGDAVLDRVHRSYIRSEDGLVAAVGLDDVVVVSTGDAVLVASADEAPNVGRLVERMRGDSRCEAVRNGTVHRPWGHFKTVDGGPRHQVKQIVVAPGGRLSLQLHHHRSEHWVVVSGTARVVCGNDERVLYEDESIHIPAGSRHRLENPGRIPLKVIEVQCGSYLGEDDIVRVEDVYGRS